MGSTMTTFGIPHIRDYRVLPDGTITLYGQPIGHLREPERQAVNDAHAKRERLIDEVLDIRMQPLSLALAAHRPLPGRSAIRQRLGLERRGVA